MRAGLAFRAGPAFRAALALLLALACVQCVGGCAAGPTPGDPWEKTNRFVYNFNEGLDHVALKPASDAYVKYVPKPIRTGIGNGFDNLVYFNVVLNDFLQGKWRQGFGDAERMAANSTVGVGGIFDPATGWGLPAHKNDFGITLGKRGVGPGPYLVLPLFGPSTARDVTGLGVEYACTPLTYLCLPYRVTIPLDATEVIDDRSRADSIFKFRNETALDPYVFTRNAYLQYRQSLILGGKPPATQQSIFDTDDDDDAGPTSGPGPSSAPGPSSGPTTAPASRPAR